MRLAFETGTEGDRQRRYVLSYERLVNRRIDTFLKVRKASASGELDLIELQQSMGADNLTELLVDAGIMTRPDPVSESTNTSTTPAAVQSDTDEELPSVSVFGNQFAATI